MLNNHSEILTVLSGISIKVGHCNKDTISQPSVFLMIVAMVVGTLIFNTIFNLTVIGSELAWKRLSRHD